MILAPVIIAVILQPANTPPPPLPVHLTPCYRDQRCRPPGPIIIKGTPKVSPLT